MPNLTNDVPVTAVGAAVTGNNIEDAPIAEIAEESRTPLEENKTVRATTASKESGSNAQIISRTMGPDVVVAVETPPKLDSEQLDDFGRMALISTLFKEPGHSYKVETLPFPPNVSPFKEMNVSQMEASILFGSMNAPRPENALMSYFTLPRGYTRHDHDNSAADGVMRHSHIPVFSILRDTLAGMVDAHIDYPVIGSPHPASTASYVNGVMMRRANDAVDLRYVTTASDNGKMIEHYTMGRIWVPLHTANFIFTLNGDNYDAFEPELEPAFDLLRNPMLNHPKDISSFNVTMRFADIMDAATANVIFIGLKQLAKVKMSLTRLYWRMYSLLYEALYWEERGEFFAAEAITSTNLPLEINNAQVMQNLLDDTLTGMNPFFVSHQMLSELNHINVLAYMHLLLCDEFRGPFAFATTAVWPDLHRTQLCFFPVGGRPPNLHNALVVRSNHMYNLIQWFANHTGQLQLMEEIGRVVATFLYRPEGDGTFMGHHTIGISLPLFRSGKSIMYIWPSAAIPTPYPQKIMALYKVAWIGIVHYMLLSLSFNAALSEHGLFTIMQLIHNHVPIPHDTLINVGNIFVPSHGRMPIVDDAQRASLRLGFGQIWNRITSSILIYNIAMPNFSRMVQWSEWAMFARFCSGPTWFSSMISHFSAQTTLSLGARYRSSQFTDSGIKEELFYRLDTFAIGEIDAITASAINLPNVHGGMRAISATSGLALDGQFVDYQVSNDERIIWSFRSRSTIETHAIANGWNKRKTYTWEITSTADYSRDQLNNRQDEMMRPVIDFGGNIGRIDQMLMPPVAGNLHLSVYMNMADVPAGVIRFGHPQPTAGRSSTSNQRTTQRQNAENLVAPYDAQLTVEALHYCDPKHVETQGEKLLHHRARLPLRTNKHLHWNSDDVTAEIKTNVLTHETYFHQQAKERDRRMGRANLEFLQGNRNQPTWSNTTEDTAATVPIRTKRPHPVESVVKHVRPRIEFKNILSNPVVSVWDREVASFIKNGTLSPAELNQLIEVDPILCEFKKFLTVSAIELANREFLCRMVRNLLPIVEQLNYTDVVVKYPIEMRGQYFRCVMLLLNSLAGYAPASGVTFRSFHNIATDFKRLSLGLSEFPYVKQDEWDTIMPHVKADEVINTILSNDGLDAVMLLIYGNTAEEAQAQIVRAAIASETSSEITDDTSLDDGKHLPHNRQIWRTSINSEPILHALGHQPLTQAQLNCWTHDSCHASSGPNKPSSNSSIKILPTAFYVNTCHHPCDENPKEKDTDEHSSKIQVCIRAFDCPCFPPAPTGQQQTITNFLHFLIYDFKNCYCPNKCKYSGPPRLRGGATCRTLSLRGVRIQLIDTAECIHRRKVSPTTIYIQQWPRCPFSGAHRICLDAFQTPKTLQTFLSDSIAFSKSYFDGNHALTIDQLATQWSRNMRNLFNDGKMDMLYSLIYRTTPAVMPAEQRLRLVPAQIGFCDLQVLSNAIDYHTCDNTCYNRMHDFDSYLPAPPAVSTVFQVHAVYVVESFPHLLKLFSTLRCTNPTMVNFELGGYFMWWALQPPQVRAHFLEAGLDRVDINKQSRTIAERLEVVRQQGSLCTCAVGEDCFQWLRKFSSLKGRDFGFCDAPLEEYRHRYSYSRRYALGLNGAYSRGNYLTAFRLYARKLITQVVTALRHSRPETIEEWWTLRKHRVPAGSSTERHLLDPYRLADPNILNVDRPNKKAVIEVYPFNLLLSLLQQNPASCARRSTKYEPGRKHRALYAADDLSTLVAAYASYEVEKHMNILGMCPQQRPADVLKWWRAHDKTRAPQVWLSADYTDFNKEHSMVELMIINYTFADAWLEQCWHKKAGWHKAAASLWTAQMLKRRLVICSDSGRSFPVFSALWSGSRDTARDNTLLHQIYYELICHNIAFHDIEFDKPSQIFMCGDDEDAIFNSVIDAAIYYESLKFGGWHANDTKQMCGFKKHEFLQKSPSNTSCCVGPVSAMIAAMSSGQWYKTPGMHQDCAVSCISDQCWELYIRGAQLESVLQLAWRILNSYMRAWYVVNINEGDKVVAKRMRRKLEWLSYRLGSMQVPPKYGAYRMTAYHDGPALWHGTRDAYCVEKPPKLFYIVQDTSALPIYATHDYCMRFRPLFLKYNKIEEFPEYVRDLAAESYGSLYHHHIQHKKQESMLEWPERTATEDDFNKVRDARIIYAYKAKNVLAQHYGRIKSILHSEGVKSLPPSDAEILGIVDADLNMFNRLGGFGNRELVIDLALTHRYARPSRLWYDLHPDIECAFHLIDPALRSFLLSTGPC